MCARKYFALAFLLAFSQAVLAQGAQPEPSEANLADTLHPSDGVELRHVPHYTVHVRHGDNAVVAIGKDATLEKDATGDDVVAVFGSATSAGEAMGSVVSVFGDTHASGPVGDSAVAVFGDTYVDGKVGDSVVAVFGNIVLGPNADIAGAVVDIGGTVTRDPAALVHGGIQHVFPGLFSSHWMRPWIEHCLLYARPLAIAPGLQWAWVACACFFALYLLLALVFPDGIERCVQTLENHPGRSVLASLLTVLFSPWLVLLLLITVIGILAVPFVFLGLACAALFGKTVVLAWLGQRCLAVRGSEQPRAHVVVAVLVGGLIVTALYLVPVLGAVVFNVIGVLGLGVVIYTLMLSARSARQAHLERRPAPAAASGSAAAAAESTAAPAAAAMGPDPAHMKADPSPSGPSAATPEEPAPAAGAPAATMRPLRLTSALPRAGFWIRIAALLIDALLIGIVLNFLHHSARLELLALAAYGAVMWKLKGTTVGGIVCGVGVVRIDDRPIDWPTAIVRALSCFLSLAVAGLGFLWIAFDEESQGWHDKIAGTVVVRVPQGASLL